MKRWVATAVLWCAPLISHAETIPLWPNRPPGETIEIGPEHDTTKPDGRLVAGKRVPRTGNVSRPTITISLPSGRQHIGTAVLVCPGGGYNILAWDLEGTEVCQWLTSIGVTAALLKYRVPKRPGDDNHLLPLADAQRAMRLIRYHATKWKIHPHRIGVLGFSAGGHLAVRLCTAHAEKIYEPVDEADSVSARPDFALPIYPAYLVQKNQPTQLAPDIKVSTNTPPTFLVQTQDDNVRVENAVFYYLALKQANVPAELHIYPSGGHGYGLRPTDHTVTTWPKRAEDWMHSIGLLQPPK
ncbi:MAG: alpha/beta hydrolase [Verrucomicrobiae bacterium]|nr:alpha/beta hydrolase [Verrucomicrobiae bacterium]